MSAGADVSSGLMVAEDEQMNGEKREVRKRVAFIESQMTVMITGDKVSGVMTLSKEKGEKELNLGELGTSPLGSFQSLQSSQSSEEDKMVLDIPSSRGNKDVTI